VGRHVSVEVRVDAKELPSNSDRELECYYLQAPRVSYLPLLVPEIKRFLTDVVFDDEGARALREEDWWFEAEDGGLLKWYVRARLLPAYMLTGVGTGRLGSSMTRISSRLLFSQRRARCPWGSGAAAARAPPRIAADGQAAARAKRGRVQGGVQGPAEGGRLHPLGEHEAHDRAPQGRAGRHLGGHPRACVISSHSSPSFISRGRLLRRDIRVV
jgi:hypothetical protein